MQTAETRARNLDIVPHERVITYRMAARLWRQ